MEGIIFRFCLDSFAFANTGGHVILIGDDNMEIDRVGYGNEAKLREAVELLGNYYIYRNNLALILIIMQKIFYF